MSINISHIEYALLALEPFAKLARKRYPEEGGAPSFIDIMTANGEQDELLLSSHVGPSNHVELLDGQDFRKAAQAWDELSAAIDKVTALTQALACSR